MIELLKQKINSLNTHDEKYAELREYLQLLILRILEIKGCYKNLAFVGGTSLRILYGLNRFSEDLDFSLINPEGYDFKSVLEDIKSILTDYGFDVGVTKKEANTVHNSYIKFSNILFELGLSPQKTQVLSVKLEIDTKPPAGYALLFTPINMQFLLNIRHYDLSSLFAGKLHAILCRKYEKGRDWYDLVWFIAKKIKPNYDLLDQAFHQTQDKSISFDRYVLIEKLSNKLNGLDVNILRRDVSPFLKDKTEIRFIEKDALRSTIHNIL